MSKTNPKKPVHRVKAGPIEVSIWENDSREGTFFSMTLGRFYKDKQDKWQTADSFGVRNELNILDAVQEACAWARSQEGAELPPAAELVDQVDTRTNGAHA